MNLHVLEEGITERTVGERLFLWVDVSWLDVSWLGCKSSKG